MLYTILIILVIAAWATAYFAVLRPKLVTFKATAGLYAKIEAFEGPFLAKLLLHAKGSKVAIVGFIASMAPLFGPTMVSLEGFNWAAVFPTERAAAIAFTMTAIAVAAPLVMTLLHSMGLAEAVTLNPAVPALPSLPATPDEAEKA